MKKGMVPKTSSRDRARWLACISATLLRPTSISAASEGMIPLQEALRQSSPCLIRRLFKTRKSLYSMAFTSTMAEGGKGAATETTRRKRWGDEFKRRVNHVTAIQRLNAGQHKQTILVTFKYGFSVYTITVRREHDQSLPIPDIPPENCRTMTKKLSAYPPLGRFSKRCPKEDSCIVLDHIICGII